MPLTPVSAAAAAPTEADYHMFREVNDHLRATEQKHLQVSIGFISATALALSFLVPATVSGDPWTPLLHSWPRCFAYFVLVLAGSATMFAQHVYRGWKKDYLLAGKKLVYWWPIHNDLRVNWMRTDRGPYGHADRTVFRLAGDNVLFWFVMIITTCIVSLLFVSLGHLLTNTRVLLALLIVGCLAYVTMIVYITAGGVRRKEHIETKWDEFCRMQKTLE